MSGFIMKKIVDHHLQPFSYDEGLSPSDLPENDHVIELSSPPKEKTSSLPHRILYILLHFWNTS
jgi:hypothetical protein